MYRIVIAFLLVSNTLFAQEGMWLPNMLKTNEADMQSMGFQLSAEDVYSDDQASMKDAIVLFDGICTGEIISEQGIVLTNHHCGFSSINELSTLENNYLRDGFWAKNQQEEIPAPGVTVVFIVRMEDVSAAVLKGLDMQTDQSAIIGQRIDSIKQAAIQGTHYGSFIKPLYYGNVYYLYVTETFEDVRLVGTPPRSVGEFGGETDNWVWPRHTGDFSIWRIYADKNNMPAAYSADNKPYKPRYHFPVSTEGVQEGDFTMVFGFPGRTTEYLPAVAVKNTIELGNPTKVALRDIRLHAMNEFMLNNDTITLMYASKTRSLANAYKKWKGETKGLVANNAVQHKQTFQQSFESWAKNTKYAGITYTLDSLHTELIPYLAFSDYTAEGVMGIEALRHCRFLKDLAFMIESDSENKEAILTEVEKVRKSMEGFYKNYHQPIDVAIFPGIMQAVYKNVDHSLLPPYFLEQVQFYNNNFDDYATAVFRKSAMGSLESLNILLDAVAAGKYDALSKDPLIQLYLRFAEANIQLAKNKTAQINLAIDQAMKLYMAGIMESGLKERLYPDANLTLRVAYGTVRGFTPNDGLYYKHYTTHQGLLEKYKAGDEEFDMPDQLVQQLRAGNFGRYAMSDGNLPVAFLASNHTTGGNSGSPVLNAQGELIGINFDRVWEGTMSDIMYDVARCRNISVDIRYILYITEYVGGANWLVKEITQ
jgi:hypothetical protein